MPLPTHIRPATADDQESVVDLALTNEMFGADELDGLRAAFDDAVGTEAGDHQWFVATTSEDRVVAAAYLAPEPFADRVWNLYFLAVHPDAHGEGTGTELVGHVEDLLHRAGEAGARVLIVETSSTQQYAATRAFYRARGFHEEARVREYYGPGDDKVIFWKSLTD